MSPARIRLKRVYEPPARQDGTRILVDAMWPRGVSKAEAAVDFWAKEVAPSAELRRWFGHDPARWQEFRRRYREELAGKKDALARLAEAARGGPVTLLFAARDATRNNAAVLKEALEELDGD